MFDTKKYNSNCEFNSEIVSYLYNEFNNSEKTNFEKHLNDCSTCVDEIAAFGFVRSSIQDWKAVDFDNLTVPKIEIEFDLPKANAHLHNFSSENLTLIERFRLLLSPLVIKTATGFAAIAVIFGLGWFMINSISKVTSENVVENNLENSDSKPKVVNNENTLTPETARNDDGNQSTNDFIDEKKKAVENPEVANDLKEPSIEKVKTNNVSPANTSNSSKSNNILSKKSAVPKITKQNPKPKSAVPTNKKPVIIEHAPSLVEYAVDTTDDEDEIRLSDIFDEVGSKD